MGGAVAGQAGRSPAVATPRLCGVGIRGTGRGASVAALGGVGQADRDGPRHGMEVRGEPPG